MVYQIKIPFTSHTIESLLDTVDDSVKALKPLLFLVISFHVLALITWIILLIRQKPASVRTKVDLTKES